MASRRLTKILKEDIESAIRQFILEKIEKSAIYKEQQERLALIQEAMLKVVCEHCPEHEMAVLVKHHVADTQNTIYVEVDHKNERVMSSWRNSTNKFKLEFDPGVLIPRSWTDSILLKKACEDETVKKMIMMADTANNHIQCELKETTEAYMKIVDQFNTVKQLLDKNPTFERFIPEEEKPPEKVTPERALNIIKTFEETE